MIHHNPHHNPHHHHHHQRRRHRHYRRFSPLGFLFPLIFFVVFVSGNGSVVGLTFPILFIICVISIIAIVVKNSSNRNNSDRYHSSRANSTTYTSSTYPNRTSYSSATVRNDQARHTYVPSAASTPIESPMVVCSSCHIELDANSQNALEENGFVYCSFCGNKLIK